MVWLQSLKTLFHQYFHLAKITVDSTLTKDINKSNRTSSMFQWAQITMRYMMFKFLLPIEQYTKIWLFENIVKPIISCYKEKPHRTDIVLEYMSSHKVCSDGHKH